MNKKNKEMKVINYSLNVLWMHFMVKPYKNLFMIKLNQWLMKLKKFIKDMMYKNY